MLVIELADRISFEGALSVDVKNFNWKETNLAAGNNTKIHFINMFSNPNGDHHFEDGGTDTDALWTLRAGASKTGELRYVDNFKILWSSKGAKRSPDSDYHEVKKDAPKGWDWEETTNFNFFVSWSKKQKIWTVAVNGLEFYKEKWDSQVDSLKYIYLGKSKDFHSLVDPYFSNLRIYETSAKNPIILKSTEDFEIETEGHAPFYRDRNKRKDYIAINPMKFEDKWAAAKTIFQAQDGIYDITITTYKEYDGESSYLILVNDEVIADFQNPQIMNKSFETDYDLTISGIKINNGDIITVEAKSHSNKVLPEEGAPGGYGWSRGRWKQLLISQ